MERRQPVNRANGHRWRALIPLGVATTLSLTGDLTLYAVLPTHTAVVGISLAAVGVLLGVNRLIRILTGPLVGALYDRGNQRRLFLTGLALGTLSTASYAVVHGFWPLLLGRLLWGLAWSLIAVGGYSMVLAVTTPADRGRITGLYQNFDLLGLAAGPLVGGFLTDVLGFRPALAICAALIGLGFLVVLIFLPSKVRSRPVADGEGDRHRPLPAIWGIWRGVDRRELVADVMNLVNWLTGNGVLMSTLGLFLQRRLGERVVLGGLTLGVATLTGSLLAARSLLPMIAGPLAGHASDRGEQRWTVVGWGMALGLLGFLALALDLGPWLILGGVLLIAAGGGVLSPALVALVGDVAPPKRQSTALGRFTAAGDLGGAAGPFLAYALAAWLDLRWVYLLCAASFLATLGLLWARRHACKEALRSRRPRKY